MKTTASQKGTKRLLILGTDHVKKGKKRNNMVAGVRAILGKSYRTRSPDALWPGCNQPSADQCRGMEPIGGGFVFQQVHNILADVPPANVVAMYETANED